ncbi:uncharacterized protein [Drosophila kikkawai]|uniref:Tumor protein p53-inducible protein 13 n=1 Tax=Drosophila kikkawai TaxID=30033 RepID=A0A6P4IGU3_DROKI|nr:uncharacterized protein LOC108075086 [Drosophila kikkawai]
MFLLTLFAVLCLGLACSEAKSIKKSHVNMPEPTLGTDDDWQGKWFPYAPGEPHIPQNVQRVQATASTLPTDNWTGKWFPYVPGEPHVVKVAPQEGSTTPKDSWTGKYFPQSPNEPHKVHKKPLVEENTQSLNEIICDNGKSNLRLDYDPNDIRDSLNYLCISSNRSQYQPDLTREALLTEHFLPSAYLPPAKCMNESIEYTHLPVTNGPYRPLPAEYGVYSYLPPQRYLRNLAEGAIVMLHHPCASPGQVAELQHMVSGCLYRHLISPSQTLSAERPLALLAWSRSLEMSVVDRRLVADFIQKHAKQGPLALEELSRVVDKREAYKEGLTTEARLVTTADDYELCGYMREGM